MSAADLLSRLSGAGFRFRREDDALVVAPAAGLTGDDRQAIRAHKAELLALLIGVRSDSASDDPAHRPHMLTTAEADFCHGPAWSEAEATCFVASVVLFMRRGLAADDADDLAERLILRARKGDERRVCLECGNLARGMSAGLRCMGVDSGVGPEVPPALIAMPQRCPAFVPDPALREPAADAPARPRTGERGGGGTDVAAHPEEIAPGPVRSVDLEAGAARNSSRQRDHRLKGAVVRAKNLQG